MRLVAIAIFSAIGVPFALGDDWPQLMGPTRDGVSREAGLVASWPAAGPKTIWRRDVGAGYAGPVVVANRLILFHRVKDAEVVECLDAASGKAAWTFSYPCDYSDAYGKGDGPRATPAIASGRVICHGAEGTLTCLDFATGAKVWQRKPTAEYKAGRSFFGVGTSPLIFEDRVLVNVGGKEAGIVAFDLADGKELWRATKDAASYSSPILMRVDETPLAVFFTREGVVVLDPRTGRTTFQKRWRARIDASVNAAVPLALGGDRVFFSSSYDTGGILLKLGKNGADVLWTDEEAMANHYNTCVAHDGLLYGCDGRQESGTRLRCVDPAGPKALWTKEGFGCASIVRAGAVLYLLAESGDLVAVEANPREYRELARARVFERTPARSHAALSGGVLYARDAGALAAFDLRK